MKELQEWLQANKISFRPIDSEVVEIEEFGKLYLANLDLVSSIFKVKDGEVEFNLMESPDILMREGINYVAFQFGKNWYYYDLRKEFQFNILKYIGKRLPQKLDIDYVNLGIHTPFELLNGSGSIKQWVDKAKYLGHKAIGICDKNTMASTLLVQNECAASGIKHVFGYSFILDDGEVGVEMKIYSLNKRGLQNMLRVQKEIMVDSENQRLTISQLLNRGAGNVLVIGKLSSHWIKENQKLVENFKQNFERVFYQVDVSEYRAERVDVEVLNATKFYFDNFVKVSGEEIRYEIDPILIADNYYLDSDDYKNKIILNKIDTRAAHNQSLDQYYKDVDEHWETFSGLMGEKWDAMSVFKTMCHNTVWVSERAEAAYDTGRMYMPEYTLTESEREKYGDRHTMFLQLLEEGFEKLVPKGKEEVYRKQLDFETYILESTNNVDYMLVQYDTVNWARENDILVGAGRGSAGGSLVLYLLGITLIDPIKYDLLFERFLLPERAGLYEAEVTKLTDDVESCHYVRVTIDGKTICFDSDAQFLVKRGDDTLEVYADELEEGDDIIFDNRDLLWGI